MIKVRYTGVIFIRAGVWRAQFPRTLLGGSAHIGHYKSAEAAARAVNAALAENGFPPTNDVPPGPPDPSEALPVRGYNGRGAVARIPMPEKITQERATAIRDMMRWALTDPDAREDAQEIAFGILAEAGKDIRLKAITDDWHKLARRKSPW